MKETYTATVDRIVGGERAVLLLEATDSGETIGEVVVPQTRLPEAARNEGAMLEVTLEQGEIADIEYLTEETEVRREELQKRFDQLSKRLDSADQ